MLSIFSPGFPDKCNTEFVSQHECEDVMQDSDSSLDNVSVPDMCDEDFSCDSNDDYVPESFSSSSRCASEMGDNAFLGNLQYTVEEDTAFDYAPTSAVLVTEESQNSTISEKRSLYTCNDKKSRKRIKNEKTWKRKSAAIARERGKEYVSYQKKIKAKKEIQRDVLCNENCRFQCSKKFGINDRENILRRYYSLDVNGKNVLLFGSIVSSPPKRPSPNAKTCRSISHKYFISFGGNKKQVCKLAMCALYQISRGKIDMILREIKSGVSAPNPDCRGKHKNRPHKMDKDVVNRIIEHISSFPAEQSHYSRNKNIHKLYLSPLLNVSKLHRLYIEKCEEENLPDKYKIKISSFSKIFETEFNLSFGYPKSDTCATCDAGEANEEHKENYHAATEAMQADRKKPQSDNNVLFITVDLQQIMPLPKLSTSKAYYLRQLAFYNFGIHVIDGTPQEKAVCCTWTEDVADRGSAEVASSLLRFVEVDSSCEGKDHLIVWSDSCPGQNKNFNLICFYQYLILKGHFKIIDHKFPEVGHSYLDSDRDFGRIEKALRKHDTIYAPEQYHRILAKASKNNVVMDMTGHFRKINDLQLNLNLINRKKTVSKEKINFRDGIKWIRVDEYGSYLFKESHDEMTPFKKADILKKRTEIDADFVLERVVGKYGTVSVEKKSNIEEQLKFVKPGYRHFYEAILREE